MNIEFPSFGLAGVAKLYTDHAPRTVRALHDVLPLQGPAIHAIRAGREVFSHLPPLSSEPGPENQSVFPAPGDLYLFHRSAGHRTLEQPRRLGERGSPESTWHIAIWYGRDSLPMTPSGLEPGNHFGEIVDGLDRIAEACERIRFEGVVDVRFALVDGLP
jgi:hypothetical protein